MATDDTKASSVEVHRVRFYEHKPLTINCMTYDENSQRIAISRSDASVQILSTKDNWTQELFFPGSADASIEGMVWCQGRLFAAGLGGNVVEFDLTTCLIKDSVSSNGGPIWCLAKNSTETQLAAGTEDGCVVLFDVTEDLCFHRSFGKQIGRLLSIAWYCKDQENIIITGGVNIIRLWSVKSGQAISRMTLGRVQKTDTLVWCIGVTSNFTVISGDSRGVVTFWNGKESTQIKTFSSHKADVLSLCLDQKETTVYTGGVDGALFSYCCAMSNPSSHVHWIQQPLHHKHTHDIRALAYADGFLASGGVDSLLEVARVNAKKPSIYTISHFSYTPVVHVGKDSNKVLLQYPKSVEIWCLGEANRDESCESSRGILPMNRKPSRLVQLNARPGVEILCSDISSDGTSFAFSDSKNIRFYQLELTFQTAAPEVKLKRVHVKVSAPARLMTFSQDAKHLLLIPVDGAVQILNLESNKVTRVGRQTAPIKLLTCSPDSQHFALATTDHKVQVYSVQTGERVCSCPVLPAQVTALAFSPHGPWLTIAYSNHSVYEVDIVKKEYSPWSRKNSIKFEPNWLRPLKPISNITFSPHNPELILLCTDVILGVIDKAKLDKEEDDFRVSERDKCYIGPVRKNRKYKYLMSADFLNDGMLVVVEQSPSMIEDALPPSLKQKKFGIS